MRENPICVCGEEVGSDPVYEAPCGHDDCVSLAWHPVCLMRFRDEREEAEKKKEEAEREMEQLAKALEETFERLFRGPEPGSPENN